MTDKKKLTNQELAELIGDLPEEELQRLVKTARRTTVKKRSLLNQADTPQENLYATVSWFKKEVDANAGAEEPPAMIQSINFLHRMNSWNNQGVMTGGNIEHGVAYNNYVADEFSFHSGFTLMNAMDLWAEYTTTEPVFSQFNTFLFISGYAGEYNIPVDVYGMADVLGLQQATLSRILSALSEATEEELIAKAEREHRLSLIENDKLNTSNPAVANALHKEMMEGKKSGLISPVENKILEGDGSYDDLESTRYVLKKVNEMDKKYRLNSPRALVKHGLIQPAHPERTTDVTVSYDPAQVDRVVKSPINSDPYTMASLPQTVVNYGKNARPFVKDDFRQNKPKPDGRKKYVNLTDKGFELARKLREVILYDQDPNTPDAD